MDSVLGSSMWVSVPDAPEVQLPRFLPVAVAVLARALLAVRGGSMTDDPSVRLEGRWLLCACDDRPIRIDTGTGWRSLAFTLVCPACGVDMGKAWDELRAEAIKNLEPYQGQ